MTMIVTAVEAFKLISVDIKVSCVISEEIFNLKLEWKIMSGGKLTSQNPASAAS